MNKVVELIFTRSYGQWKTGEIVTFPVNVAENIIKAGAATVRNPEMPKERKTTKSKVIKK
jgi:hypothetical protein